MNAARDRCPCGSKTYHAACLDAGSMPTPRKPPLGIEFDPKVSVFRVGPMLTIQFPAKEVIPLAKAKKKSGKKKGAGSKMSGTKAGKY